jgi:hypothetical protein
MAVVAVVAVLADVECSCGTYSDMSLEVTRVMLLDRGEFN